MKFVQYNEYLVNTVATDGLVFEHQGLVLLTSKGNNKNLSAQCLVMIGIC